MKKIEAFDYIINEYPKEQYSPSISGYLEDQMIDIKRAMIRQIHDMQNKDIAEVIYGEAQLRMKK